jgi:TonB family protein
MTPRRRWRWLVSLVVVALSSLADGGGAGSSLARLRAPDAGTSVQVVDPPVVLLPDGGVQGSLNKDHIRGVIRRSLDRVRGCYEAYLKKRDLEAPDGKLVVRFVIGPDGVVREAALDERTSLADDDLGACVLAVMKSLRFQRPAGGGSVTVNYPFIFKHAPD